MTAQHLVGCRGFNCKCEERRYWRVFFIAIAITMVEVLGGLYSRSLLLLSDAGHVFIDGVSCLVAIVVAILVRKNYLSRWPLRRVGGYVHYYLLLFVGVLIAAEAIRRLVSPGEIVTWVMLVVAIIGAVANWWQHRILDESHQHNITSAGLKYHVHSDMMQSLGVIFASLAIWFTGLDWIDPVVAIIISWRMFIYAKKLRRIICSS